MYETNASFNWTFSNFVLILRTIKKNTEILLKKNEECLFSYLHTLTFTVKALKVTYYYTQDSNNEATVNKECENCMKETFNPCITLHFKNLS